MTLADLPRRVVMPLGPWRDPKPRMSPEERQRRMNEASKRYQRRNRAAINARKRRRRAAGMGRAA